MAKWPEAVEIGLDVFIFIPTFFMIRSFYKRRRRTMEADHDVLRGDRDDAWDDEDDKRACTSHKILATTTVRIARNPLEPDSQQTAQM